MLKNNKGFMLVEVVITSTVVLTGLVILYTTFTKLYSAYNVRNSYFNIDGVYASREGLEHLINSDGFNRLLSDEVNGFYANKYIYLIKDEEVNSFFAEGSDDDYYLEALKGLYNIDNMMIIEWSDNIVVKDIMGDPDIKETFKDYLNSYVVKHYNFSENQDYSYLVITEYKKENNASGYNYSSINLR